MNKKISAPIAIACVFALAVLVITAIVIYDMFWIESKPIPQIKEEMAGQDWKSYSAPGLGIKFNYPSQWVDFKLINYPNTPTLKGNFYSGNDGLEQLEFFSYSKDFQPFEQLALNQQMINPNWSKEEFATNMKVEKGNILLYKKLSDKALFVGIFDNPECSPFVHYEVITPINESYPNLEISIIGRGFNEEINDIESQCDLSVADIEMAKRVEAKTYSNEMNKNIEIATQIANSVEQNIISN